MNCIKKIRSLLVIFSVCEMFIQTNAQISRTSAMGGLTYSVIDRDEYFDPYLLGGNPAWIVNSRLKKYLEISPMQGNVWGNYRRIYSAKRILDYNTNFIWVKPLGKSGTFLGKAIYNYEIRKDNYRTLKMNTYAGEAFFFTDTTSGNVIFNGPLFEFSHSVKILKNLFFGASIRYQILDGLKKVYTYAQTLYRDMSEKIGIAYRFYNNLVLGFDIASFDSKEAIVASDVNLMSVVTYEFRGEKYAVELTSGHQHYKLRKYGKKFGGQIYFTPGNKTEIGLASNYYVSDTKVLIPNELLINSEDGYASFDGYNINLKGRTLLSKRLTTGMRIGYYFNESWSKNSKRNLLIWQWNTKSVIAGFGTSYFVLPGKLLIGSEYEIHFVSSDSLKYIDNIFSNISSVNYYLRTGVEYTISKKLKLRFGYDYILKNHDFIYGGNNVFANIYTAGFSIKLLKYLKLDGDIKYVNFALKYKPNFYRSRLNWAFTLRFFSF